MRETFLPYASYSLWSSFQPAVGKEQWHCDMKRGFTKVRQKEPQVKAILDQDSTSQRVGKLAQKGVYEFHQDPILLDSSDSVKIVAKILNLNEESDEVQSRVMLILQNYHANPILIEKNIINLGRGDEKSYQPIQIQQGSYIFNLYAPTDCIFSESDGRIHILDFKTGKSEFDRRQAYVYLLATSYTYPKQQATASFYNLEKCLASDLVTANPEKLKFVQIELEDIAKRHEEEKKRYLNNRDYFSRIFLPNPGPACISCQFKSICEYSI